MSQGRSIRPEEAALASELVDFIGNLIPAEGLEILQDAACWLFQESLADYDEGDLEALLMEWAKNGTVGFHTQDREQLITHLANEIYSQGLLVEGQTASDLVYAAHQSWKEASE